MSFIRAATQAIHSNDIAVYKRLLINYESVQDDTPAAATPAPCTARDHDGSPRVQLRDMLGCASRLTTTPSRETVALHDHQPRQHGDYTFIGNSAIDGQTNYHDDNADCSDTSSGNYNN